MALKRPLALDPVHHEGKVITVEVLTANSFICKVDGVERQAFYDTPMDAVGAGKRSIDEDVQARSALSRMGLGR